MKPNKINFGGAKAGKPLFQKKQKEVKIEYSSDEPNIEQDAEEELTELQKAFRAKGKAERETNDRNTQGVFWSCVVFKTEEERDEFLKLLGLFGTDEENVFVNGSKLIKALELKIAEVEQKVPGKFRVNKEIAELSMSIV